MVTLRVNYVTETGGTRVNAPGTLKARRRFNIDLNKAGAITIPTTIPPETDPNSGDSLSYGQRGGELLRNMALDIATPRANRRVLQAADVARTAVDGFIDHFFEWIAHQFMDESASHAPPELAEMGVIWKALDPDYLKFKRGTGFFVHTNKLRATFLRKKGLAAFGKSEVKVTKTRRNMISRVQVSIANKIATKFAKTTGQMLSVGMQLENELFTRGGRFEMSDDLIRRKLQGKREYYRAMVGPALSYYVTRLLPSVVAAALKRSRFKIKPKKGQL